MGRTLFFTVVSCGEGEGGHDSVIFHTTIQTLNTPTSVCLNGRGPWCECILCCRHRQDQTVQNKYKPLRIPPQRSSTSAHGHLGLMRICRNLRSSLPDLARATGVVFVSQRNCETATSQEQCQRRGSERRRGQVLQLQTDNQLFLCDLFSHLLTLIARVVRALLTSPSDLSLK